MFITIEDGIFSTVVLAEYVSTGQINDHQWSNIGSRTLQQWINSGSMMD